MYIFKQCFIIILGCPACNSSKPEFIKAARLVHQQGKGKIGIFNNSEDEIIMDKYQIISFPTLKLFVSGRVITDYKGPRIAKDIITFIEKAIKGKDEL